VHIIRQFYSFFTLTDYSIIIQNTMLSTWGIKYPIRGYMQYFVFLFHKINVESYKFKYVLPLIPQLTRRILEKTLRFASR